MISREHSSRYRGDGREPTAADAGEFLKRQSDWSVIGKDFREKVPCSHPTYDLHCFKYGGQLSSTVFIVDL